MYYDIHRKRVGNAGLLIVETDNGQSIDLFDGEGKSLANVNTAYDCPEDNTVRRLGILDFVEKAVLHSGSTQAPVDAAFEKAPYHIVDDGQATGDSTVAIIPIRYLVGEDVILYADSEGWMTPFAVDSTLDEDPVDVFNQHLLAAGFITEDERYSEVKK